MGMAFLHIPAPVLGKSIYQHTLGLPLWYLQGIELGLLQT